MNDLRGRSDVHCDRCGCDDGVALTAPPGLGTDCRPRSTVVYCEKHNTFSRVIT